MMKDRKKPPMFVEYQADTPEGAAEIRRIAEKFAADNGLKCTVTEIEVHTSTEREQ